MHHHYYSYFYSYYYYCYYYYCYYHNLHSDGAVEAHGEPNHTITEPSWVSGA